MPITSQRSKCRPRWTGRRVLDFAMYLVIAATIGFGVVWFAYNSEGKRNDVIARWGGLIVNTAIVYGYVVKESRPFWRAWGFWLAIISVLSLHLLLFVVVLQRVQHWSVLWFLLMYPVEIPALGIACDWALQVTRGQPRYRSGARHHQ